MLSMSHNGIDTVRLEYEHLYNLRNQTLLFLELCPEKGEYAGKIREEPDLMLKGLISSLSSSCPS